MSILKVVWDDNALNLLLERDRYTRQSIRDDFRRDPLQSAIEVEPKKHVTSVANKQYGVVWRLDDARQEARVSAVVPFTNPITNAPALKAYLESVVKTDKASAKDGVKVVWEDQALNLLLDRDRYTRQSIRDEFRSGPLRSAIEFDPEHRGFVTFVANKRYSVVSYLDKNGNEALVRAVVPLTNVTTKGPALKAYIERVVEAESKGEITL